MMKSVLNPDEIELSDISLIERFEELFERTVKVIDDTDQNIVLVNEFDLILFRKNNHYNVITSYLSYYKHRHVSFKNKTYCFTHSYWIPH